MSGETLDELHEGMMRAHRAAEEAEARTASFTPGPWRVDARGYVMDNDGHIVARPHRLHEAPANARLMSAAPEMWKLIAHLAAQPCARKKSDVYALTCGEVIPRTSLCVTCESRRLLRKAAGQV